MQLWQIIENRWLPDSPVFGGLKTIPTETARNEIFDLVDEIKRLSAPESINNAANLQDQLKAAERRIMLLEAELKQSRYKLEAAQSAADPATIQEYADFYSVAVQQFSVTGEIPMTYSEWLADANEGTA